jgi:hypothetical protein
MEINAELCDEIYEVEKIIARKIYKSKKYYLIKWLYFPINESTWEPKSNLTNINYMMNKFEAEYPSSIDQYMYDIYCEEYKKKIKRTKKSKKSQKVKKLLSKKIKFECFSQSELKDIYYEKLKKHLHINNKEKNDNNDLMIEISSNKTQSDDNISNLDENEEKKFFQRLIIPEIN